MNEFIGASPFAVHDPRRAAAHPYFRPTDFAPTRKRLVAWTILTCVLLAIAVWTVLGPPEYASGPHLPSRDLTAAVR
ncbi:hypothetical protein JQ607_37100 [Bradyrhizobium liaoningense]|nr:hypothetical protein [Bradyrhizobium liaoningense]